MSKLFLLLIVTIALFGVEAGLFMSAVSRRGVIQAGKSQVEALVRRKAALLSDNERLRAAADSPEELASLRGKAAEVKAARAEIQRLNAEIARLQAKNDGSPPPPSWPDPSKVRPANSWKFAGQTSPGTTFESVLWAARAGDVDRLAALLNFELGAKNIAQALYNRLPEGTQAQYGSPEKLVATLVAGDMPTDYQAMAPVRENNAGPDAALFTARIVLGNGAQVDQTFKFQSINGNWQLDVPVGTVGAFAKKLVGR